MSSVSMFMRLLLALLVLSVITMQSFPALAGAWLQQEGKGQLISTSLYYSTSHFYDNSRNRKPQERFTKLQINPYGEYGLSLDITVGFNAFIDHVSGASPDLPGARSHNTGISDSELFARMRVWEEGSAIISFQPLIKFPSVYTSDSLPRSGSKEFDGELRMMGGYGFSLYGKNHYVSAETAYRKRFGDPADQFRTDITVGLRPADGWLILPQIFTTWRLKSPSSASFTQSGQDDYDLIKTQLSAVYELTENTGLQAGAFQHIYARNTGADGGVLFALWKRF